MAEWTVEIGLKGWLGGSLLMLCRREDPSVRIMEVTTELDDEFVTLQ